MKVFVKRDSLYRFFQKAKLEINNVSELTFISFGLEKQLKSTLETITWIEKRLHNGKFDETDDEDEYYVNRLKDLQNDIKLLEGMINSLKIQNQIDWKTKKPTQ